MYSKFRDLKKYTGSDDVLQIEALNWNGEYLDEKIPGFTTLNVEGRENFSRAINAPEMASGGNLYLSSRFEAKVITVSFQLLAGSGTELQDRFDRLKNWLYQPQKQFFFADETNYYYIGTVSKVENAKAGQLNIIGTIEITCSDPYKHGKAKTVTNQDISDSEIQRPLVPNKITFAPTNDMAKLNLTTSDNMKIIVNRGLPAGQKVTIDFKNLTIKYGSTSVLIDLDLTSNLGDFTIQNGTQIRLGYAGDFSIEYEVTQI